MAYADWITKEELWCNDCDAARVHSDKPETGKFFCQCGHVWEPTTQTLGEYQQVIYALCTACLKKEG